MPGSDFAKPDTPGLGSCAVSRWRKAPKDCTIIDLGMSPIPPKIHDVTKEWSVDE